MKCEEYGRCYHIMCVSDMLKDMKYEFDCYEDMYSKSCELYDKWVEWDISNPKITDKLSWICSFIKFIKEEDK